MKNKNTMLFVCLFSVVGMGIYSLCIFVLADEYSNKFWLTYTFTMITFIFQLLTSWLWSFSKTAERDEFLEIPLFIPSSAYLVIQLCIGVVLMIIPISFKLSLVIESVVWACFILVTISLEAGREVMTESDVTTEKSIEFIRSMTIRAERIYEEEQDLTRKVQLKRLWETIRYSDPVSDNELVYKINQQIEEAFVYFSSELNTKSLEELSYEVNQIINLMNRRNSICKMNK